MPGTTGGRPGMRRLLVSYFLATSLRCQASSAAGITGKTSAQRARGTSRASAANQARSSGPYRTRPACRRRTAFSCRSASTSASFARSPRHTRTARPNTRHASRYMILSSTRQANHHHAWRACERAGQPRNRVFERHRLSDTAKWLRIRASGLLRAGLSPAGMLTLIMTARCARSASLRRQYGQRVTQRHGPGGLIYTKT
jgi:hypothetical protein